MCGVDDPSHKSSVEDMVVCAVNTARAHLPQSSHSEQQMHDQDGEATGTVTKTMGRTDAVGPAGSSSAAVPADMDGDMCLADLNAGMQTFEPGGEDGQVCIVTSRVISQNGIEYCSGCPHGRRRTPDS